MMVIILVACDTGQGIMHGSVSMGRENWNWGQILSSLSIGLILGFLIGTVVYKRK